jgi:hypothetical protein
MGSNPLGVVSLSIQVTAAPHGRQRRRTQILAPSANHVKASSVNGLDISWSPFR